MKKTLSFILFICLSVHSVIANPVFQKIDSLMTSVKDYTEAVQGIRNLEEGDLLNYLKQEKKTLNKAKIYNALCWKFYNSDPPLAMKYAELQYSFAEKLSDKEVMVKALDNLAWLHQGFSNHEVSVEFMLRSLKINEEINNSSGISINLSGLANNYYRLGNYELALNYFEQSLNLEQKEGRGEYEGAILTNIGLCHVGLGEIDKGLSIYLKAEEVYINNKQEIEAASTYGNIGLIYLTHKENYAEALFYLKKAAQIHEETQEISGLANVYGSMSQLYTKQNDFANALIYGKLALKNAQLSGEKSEIMNANDKLGMAFYHNRYYRQAYDHFRVAYDLKDTIFDIISSEQIAEMQTKYDTEKKEAENKLLLAQQKADQAQIETKRTQQNMLLVLLMAILSIAGYILYNLQQKKKVNKLLYIKNEEISEQKAVIEEKNKDITDSINYAQRIQNAILPDLSLINQDYQSFVYYLPKDIISGDFYWTKEVGNRLYFAVVDCTGHGVPGAMVSMIGYNSLNSIIDELKIEKPGSILDELNKMVNQSFNQDMSIRKNEMIKDGMDISICMINKSNLILEYAGANNALYLYRDCLNRIGDDAPIMKNETHNFYEIKPDKMKIGGGVNKANYSTHQIQLEKNDTIYLFSDGYADQFGGEKGKKFMYKPFKRMLLSIQDQDMEKQHQHLSTTFQEWRGSFGQIDDICVMGVRI